MVSPTCMGLNSDMGPPSDILWDFYPPAAFYGSSVDCQMGIAALPKNSPIPPFARVALTSRNLGRWVDGPVFLIGGPDVLGKVGASETLFGQTAPTPSTRVLVAGQKQSRKHKKKGQKRVSQASHGLRIRPKPPCRAVSPVWRGFAPRTS